MGFDGIYSIYRKCNDKYEKLAFYDKDGKELYDLFPSRDGMLNQLLLGYNRHGYNFEDIGARRGLPEWYVDILKEEHPDWFDGSDGWSYNVDEGTYYDYLELRGWAQGDACAHKDWMVAQESDCDKLDESDGVLPEPPMRNALKDFMEQVDIYLDAYGIYRPEPGEVYIICEMSY
jgi:hypothetical protein